MGGIDYDVKKFKTEDCKSRYWFDYITNEVTAITNTSYANFWAVNNSKSKISNKYKQGVGTGSCNLIFTKSGYNSTNTQVGMGMENYQSQLSTAFVSGNVDFR